jgi:hypothetical protein
MTQQLFLKLDLRRQDNGGMETILTFRILFLTLFESFLVKANAVGIVGKEIEN